MNKAAFSPYSAAAKMLRNRCIALLSIVSSQALTHFVISALQSLSRIFEVRNLAAEPINSFL